MLTGYCNLFSPVSPDFLKTFLRTKICSISKMKSCKITLPFSHNIYLILESVWFGLVRKKIVKTANSNTSCITDRVSTDK